MQKDKLKELWHQCSSRLAQELTTQLFDTWIKPLQAAEENGQLCLFAPNQFVLDCVKQRFLNRIHSLIEELLPNDAINILLRIGSNNQNLNHKSVKTEVVSKLNASNPSRQQQSTNLSPNFTFTNFVEGNSNRIAKAAALQVAENPGSGYNPLFLYGPVGLGKTHLMQATGNSLAQHKKVLYLHSERFVVDMVRALQTNTINEFKKYYRSLDALLIDDIQFFAGKDRSQEELFHIFNALIETGSQMIFTCDRYPKEIDGLEERLKSRFGWGLTIAIEPPELETRVAILMNKAEQMQFNLSSEVAFFIAKRVRSNVRELEGALKRIIANANFTGREVNLEFARETLKDLIAMQDKKIAIENIQKTVAEYYKIKVSDLLSKRRSRSVTRPRQVAMSLAKELTTHSLPEIGEAFGGRDHTTVLHACRVIEELKLSNPSIKEDMQNLLNIFSK